jgi:hypothetical protein
MYFEIAIINNNLDKSKQYHQQWERPNHQYNTHPRRTASILCRTLITFSVMYKYGGPHTHTLVRILVC